MLGIDDFWVWSAYVLCLASTGVCVVYGLYSWNRDGAAPQPEDRAWDEEERKIDESL